MPHQNKIGTSWTGIYWLLVAIETASAAIMLWRGVPIYRNLLPGNDIAPVDASVLAAATVTVAGVQVPYWIATLKVLPLAVIGRHVVAAHLVLFLARLNFVFVSSLFVVIFFVRNDDIEFVWWRALMLFAVLFSMFCFTLELERLGKRLLGER